MRNVTVKYHRKNDRTGSFEYRRRVPKSLEKLVKKREFLKVLGKTQSEAVMRYGAEHEKIEHLVSLGEVSIYVSADRKSQSVGRQLLEALLQAADQVGYWTLVAQIFPENEPSLKLHAACGFQTLGTRKKLGQMSYSPHEGKWRDVIMLERRSKIVS